MNLDLSSFESDFIPPKNIQFFLLILDKLNKLEGKTKLLKIHYLIEKEGKVKFDSPIKTYEWGPADFSAYNVCRDAGFIEIKKEEFENFERYIIEITEDGRKFYNNLCEPNMKKNEKERAIKIINKYKEYSYDEILKHVHSKYVDPFKNEENKNRTIRDLINNLEITINACEKKLERGNVDKNSQYTLIGELYHIKEILKSLFSEEDPTKIGAITTTVSEFLEYLGLTNESNSFTEELFSFIDNYSEKENIKKSITSDDFSDIPEEERKCLAKEIAQIKAPVFS